MNVLLVIITRNYKTMTRDYLPEKEVAGWFPRVCAMEVAEQPTEVAEQPLYDKKTE